ncbi:MAG TPA: 1-acyl-sn-glycerol-3-phosphate acyltransferase [Polyangiaceae bacterium]|nr:1-acyl-sn-glycerol-3-phosphate acyltransferase [Polyangiaceae bacterium]
MTATLGAKEQALVEAVLSFPVGRPPEELAELRRRLERILSSAGGDAVGRLLGRILTIGNEFTYYEADPLARLMNRTVAEVVEAGAVTLDGVQNLVGLEQTPLLFLANHLSYSDANVLSVALDGAGLSSFADRLTVVAGPKVYSDPMRRFSSLCFGTIKTPQSTDLASEEAVMNVRDVAKVARETIALACQRERAGDALLVFVEGTRSRTHGMQKALAAVTRYFDVESLHLVPVGIAGTEHLVPVDDERLHRALVQVRLGKPAPAKALLDAAGRGNRRGVMDAIGVAIADLLPESYRGEYAESAPDLDEARRIGRSVFGPV